MGVEEWTVVVLVVGARLLIPFMIPYWPLPGAVACLIIDAADQSIFQQWPAIPLDGYQSYDKSLDIYYWPSSTCRPCATGSTQTPLG